MADARLRRVQKEIKGAAEMGDANAQHARRTSRARSLSSVSPVVQLHIPHLAAFLAPTQARVPASVLTAVVDDNPFHLIGAFPGPVSAVHCAFPR